MGNYAEIADVDNWPDSMSDEDKEELRSIAEEMSEDDIDDLMNETEETVSEELDENIEV